MNLLKLLYPDRCPICDRALPIENKETKICPDCLKKLKVVRDRMLPEGCKYLDGGMAVFAYSTVFTSLYKFKYMNRSPYAKAYAKLVVKEAGDWIKALNPDCFIPVPLHKNRLIKRGYNQAKELADELYNLTGIKVYDFLVARSHPTVPQKFLNKKSRQINMEKAFTVRENVVNLRRVVIVDDIITTGSTIDSIAKELKENGVESVYFLTFSRAGQ